jgi:hypothetical protein
MAPQTTDILERIADLHKQATTEHSHYYVASTLEASAHEIVRLRAKITNLRNAIRNLIGVDVRGQERWPPDFSKTEHDGT